MYVCVRICVYVEGYAFTCEDTLLSPNMFVVIVVVHINSLSTSALLFVTIILASHFHYILFAIVLLCCYYCNAILFTLEKVCQVNLCVFFVYLSGGGGKVAAFWLGLGVLQVVCLRFLFFYFYQKYYFRISSALLLDRLLRRIRLRCI